jgi:hypothetical protein
MIVTHPPNQEKTIRRGARQDSGAAEQCARSGYNKTGYLALTLLSGAVLLIARLLQPSAQGVGTHEQLGLPSCLFLTLTGIPCPSCGLTTSFAHAARFNFIASLTTQPFGLVAFFLTVLCIPVSIYLIRRRIDWSDFIHARRADTLMYTLIVLYLLSWCYKIIAMKWPVGGG